jgi:hypothetical protein
VPGCIWSRQRRRGVHPRRTSETPCGEEGKNGSPQKAGPIRAMLYFGF